VVFIVVSSLSIFVSLFVGLCLYLCVLVSLQNLTQAPDFPSQPFITLSTQSKSRDDRGLGIKRGLLHM
jgi:hypothetical protein